MLIVGKKRRDAPRMGAGFESRGDNELPRRKQEGYRFLGNSPAANCPVFIPGPGRQTGQITRRYTAATQTLQTRNQEINTLGTSCCSAPSPLNALR